MNGVDNACNLLVSWADKGLQLAAPSIGDFPYDFTVACAACDWLLLTATLNSVLCHLVVHF